MNVFDAKYKLKYIKPVFINWLKCGKEYNNHKIKRRSQNEQD